MLSWVLDVLGKCTFVVCGGVIVCRLRITNLPGMSGELKGDRSVERIDQETE